MVDPCLFCAGTGVDPFGILSAMSACPVCLGAGKVDVPAPSVPCAHCRGAGAVKALTCTACSGLGRLPADPKAVGICKVCQGSGDDAGLPALPCPQCGGRGTSR
jgi:DnaJ-class molecular chaperone